MLGLLDLRRTSSPDVLECKVAIALRMTLWLWIQASVESLHKTTSAFVSKHLAQQQMVTLCFSIFLPPTVAMDDDAGVSSKPPTERLDQAQSKLEAAQSELKEAQTKLEAAQSKLEAAQFKLEAAQNAWLAASHEDKRTHESIVQNAERNVQSAKEMRDVFLNAVAKMQGTMAQSEEGPVLEMLKRLEPRLERLAKNDALLFEAFLERYSLTPVSHYSSATVDGQWHRQSLEYYQTSSCLVLQKLFPQDFCVQPRWLRHTGWDSIFPAVVENIIPKKGYNFIQNELNVRIDDPRNSLPLLRHLEHAFQDGDWSLIPFAKQDGGVWFTIHVSQLLMSESVYYIDNNDRQEDVVLVRKEHGLPLQPLTFGDLHLQKLLICPPPSLRALFLKARMAWKKHKADDEPLPNPVESASVFADSCEKWDGFLVAKFFKSIEELGAAEGAQPP